MDKSLIRRLAAVGKQTETLRFSDGSELLVLPYGGRILGLYAKRDARNFFWINPALRRTDTARALFSSQSWHNTGGERTWLGPEIDYFYPHFPNPAGYRPPRALDGGTFQVEKSSGAMRLSIAFPVTSHRRRVSVRLKLVKSIEAAADPLRSEKSRAKGVQFAGYTVRTRLQFAERSAPAPSVGIWSLTQMPQGGTMLAPTYGPTRPRAFFGKVGGRDLAVTPSFVRCRMPRGGYYKIGLRAVSVTGRVGYYYESADGAHLVIRNFFDNPSGNYVDAPAQNPRDAGYGVQFCNVSDGTLGNFSELEYHAPAIGGASGKRFIEDVSQVWAYRGQRAPLAAIARQLLGTTHFA